MRLDAYGGRYIRSRCNLPAKCLSSAQANSELPAWPPSVETLDSDLFAPAAPAYDCPTVPSDSNFRLKADGDSFPYACIFLLAGSISEWAPNRYRGKRSALNSAPISTTIDTRYSQISNTMAVPSDP